MLERNNDSAVVHTRGSGRLHTALATGLTLLALIGTVSGAVRYVDVNSTNATPPYATWATAAAVIQDAVDAADPGDELVVTNGIYATGGRAAVGTATNRLAMDKPLTVRSVHGPELTLIDGAGLVRCAYLSDGASLSGFTLAHGMAESGAGVWCTSTNAFLTNCIVTGNSSTGQGGGAYAGTLHNCTLTGNSAGMGGGAQASALLNCTLTGNSGGGVSAGTLYNCIVYFNTGPGETNYDSASTLSYCCTTPLPTNGVGNIAFDPRLASANHLSAGSPCRGAGGVAYATGDDIDGEPWGNPPSIGCDEYRAGAVTGPLTVSLSVPYTNVISGYPVALKALVEGRVTDSVWAFGDGVVALNQPYVTHIWTEPGDYPLTLWAFNESFPGGVSATVTIRVAAQPVLYVAATSANPRAPYTSWSTAATSIQQAVDAPLLGALVVVVSNGVYAGGLIVDKPLALRSVNGPQFTVINGGGTNQCVFLTNGASLSGFTLTNGSAWQGAGVSCNSANAFLTNCVLTGNVSTAYGGGAYDGTLYNCVLTGNSALWGGGANASTLYNCTLTGNSAREGYGGGANNCTLHNSIVYFNTAANGANYSDDSKLNYCCTTPLPASGTNNYAYNPQLASASHLSAGSPCRGAGSAAFATGDDIDGEPWNNPPSVGCDEYRAGAVTGPLTVSLVAAYTNVTAGYPLPLTARIEGRVTDSVWVFGDGDVALNQPYATHLWTAPGNYTVTLWGFNETHPDGVSTAVTIHVVAQPVLYVAATSGNPRLPYTSWGTAATNIQQAVDAPLLGAQVVVVSNGVYAGGLKVNKALALRSVNGPPFTVINGGGSKPCVLLTNGASLSGFTLTNGYSGGSPGGGASGGTLYNCVLTDNSAGQYGGGVYGSTLYNCALSGNAALLGGGAFESALYNCTLAGNSAASGGGVSACTLLNCIVYFNTGAAGANYDISSILNYCCTTPLPTFDIGNITQAPLWVDYAGGNLRLQSNSPCINAGNNAYVTYATDLDGRTRMIGGTVDIGAYECQSPALLNYYSWLQGYGLSTEAAAAYIDSDGDGMNNWQEWVCGTGPTNSLSALRLLSVSPAGHNVTVSWQSVSGVNYFLEQNADLVSAFTLVAGNIPGQAGATSHTVTNAPGAGPLFYRVGVKSPQR
jgi:hypothetical protein